MVFCIVCIAACFCGVYRCGVSSGKCTGYLIAMFDLVDGSLSIDDGNILIGDDASMQFYGSKTNTRISRFDVSEISSFLDREG